MWRMHKERSYFTFGNGPLLLVTDYELWNMAGTWPDKEEFINQTQNRNTWLTFSSSLRNWEKTHKERISEAHMCVWVRAVWELVRWRHTFTHVVSSPSVFLQTELGLLHLDPSPTWHISAGGWPSTQAPREHGLSCASVQPADLSCSLWPSVKHAPLSEC